MSTYNINFSDPLRPSFSIAPGTYNGPGAGPGFVATSLRLYGRGSLEWGESVNEDLVRLSENFAGATAPIAPIAGQLWFKQNLYRQNTTIPLMSGSYASTNAFFRYSFTTNLWVSCTPSPTGIFPVWVTSLTLPAYIISYGPTTPNIGDYVWSIVDSALYRWDKAYAQATAAWLLRSVTSSIVTPTQPLSGSQTVSFSGTLVGANPSGLANNATVYTATITIDGDAIPISIVGSAAQTINLVISTINTQLSVDNDGTATLVGGNIVITSASLGITSSVLVVTGTLFPALTGFSIILAAIPGAGTFPEQSLIVYDQFSQKFTSPTVVDNIPTAPVDPTTGHLWINSSGGPVSGVPSGAIAVYASGSWQQLLSSSNPGAFVSSFNTRTGAVTLTSGDVTTALTYTPYNATNPAGYISSGSLTSSEVTTALGYTPYNVTNPAGYISSVGALVSSFNTRTGAVTLTSGDVTSALGYTPYNSTNPAGYVTAASSPVQSFNTRIGAIVLSSGDVISALGYTPYNSTNPAGYITAGSITSSEITTALGYVPGGILIGSYTFTWGAPPTWPYIFFNLQVGGFPSSEFYSAEEFVAKTTLSDYYTGSGLSEYITSNYMYLKGGIQTQLRVEFAIPAYGTLPHNVNLFIYKVVDNTCTGAIQTNTPL